MIYDPHPLNRRAEDMADADETDDVAIAIDSKDLGSIEAAVMTMVATAAQARQAITEAKVKVGPGSARRLLDQAERHCKAMIREGDAVIARTREL